MIRSHHCREREGRCNLESFVHYYSSLSLGGWLRFRQEDELGMVVTARLGLALSSAYGLGDFVFWAGEE